MSVFLAYLKPFHDSCGFDKIPNASKITRFKQDLLDDLQSVFEHLVDLTEPICQAINSAKVNMTIFDSSGIETFIIENNLKYVDRTIKQLKAYVKSEGYDKSYDPYKTAYNVMPSHVSTNPETEQLHINGRFCYAFKSDIVTNRLGVIRRISFYNKDLIVLYPDTVVEKKMNSSDEDKSVHDSRPLISTSKGFFTKHPLINPKVFLNDATFDSVQLCKELLSGNISGINKHFSRVYTPLNSCSRLENTDYMTNDNGISRCPYNPSFPTKSEGNTFYLRRGLPTFRFVCPKVKYIKCEDGKYHRHCQRNSPCTISPRGRMIYVYLEKDLCAFPGTIRSTKEWDNIYETRTVVERDTNHIKANLCLADRRTQNEDTLRVDLVLADAMWLMTVAFADKIKYHEYIRSLKPLTAQDLPTS